MRKTELFFRSTILHGQWMVYALAAAFGVLWYAFLYESTPDEVWPSIHPAIEILTLITGSVVASHWVRFSLDSLRTTYWLGLAFPFILLAAASLCSVLTLGIPFAVFGQNPFAIFLFGLIAPPLTMALGFGVVLENYWWVFLFSTIQLLTLRRLMQALPPQMAHP